MTPEPVALRRALELAEELDDSLPELLDVRRQMPTVVIGGVHHQAREWLSRNADMVSHEVDPSDPSRATFQAHIISQPHELRGIRGPCRIAFIGTWDHRADIEQMTEIATMLQQVDPEIEVYWEHDDRKSYRSYPDPKPPKW